MGHVTFDSIRFGSVPFDSWRSGRGPPYSNNVAAFSRVEMNPHANGITAMAQTSTIHLIGVVAAVAESEYSVVVMAQAASTAVDSSPSEAMWWCRASTWWTSRLQMKPTASRPTMMYRVTV
jgi:hypothetical protein